MIRLIVGLGNPGQDYEKTRHNAGFLFLDTLAEERACIWSNKPEFQGILATFSCAGEKIYLLKPQTFMNRSGQAVGKVARYYKIAPEEILIIHDELDFSPGTVKLKKDGGHAGHNGLKDIISHLGTKDFYRLRIGIGRPTNAALVANYVLSQPGKQEFENLRSSITLGLSHIDSIVNGDMSVVMNNLNSV